MNVSKTASLIGSIESILNARCNEEASLNSSLQEILTYFDCAVGTIHLVDEAGVLHLRSQIGLPPGLLDKVRVIPVGKGMAGLAALRKEPVQVCNLQTDNSGQAKPSAKETKMEGSITVPMIVDGKVRGTLGIAKPTAHEFQCDEVSLLQDVATLLAKHCRA